MRAVRLDDETADRMLAGVVDPADAPPGYAAVAELLGTARVAAGVPVPAAPPADRPGDFGLVQSTSVGRAAHGARSGRRRIPVLAAVAFCAMTGGAYAAGATGVGSATVSALLERIGVASLVGTSSAGDKAAATSGAAALTGEATAQTTTGAETAAPVGAGRDPKGHGTDGKGKGTGHGAEISTLARTTDAQGVDKGAEISRAASDGTSRAGEQDTGRGDDHPSPPPHPDRPDRPDHPTGGTGDGHGGGSQKPGS